jgi:hypothetical protein
MKHLIFILLSLSLAISHAKSPEEVVNVTIICYDTATLTKTLSEKYKELPIAMGKSNDEAQSTMSIWVNNQEKSWTNVATKQTTSCVIGTGTSFEVVPYNRRNS